MTEESALFLGQHALLTAMAVAGPMLMAALVVGSVVSILQAVTQVQEVTLVFVPKMLVVFVVLGLAGAWMLDMLTSFGTEMFLSIGQ